MEKVIVGISWNSDEIDKDIKKYGDAVVKAGGEVVYLPKITSEEEARKALAGVSAISVTGGGDTDPKYFGQEAIKEAEVVSPDRDLSDYLLMKVALEEDLPMLCICRGMQFLNIVSGGTVYQDIPTQKPTCFAHRDPEQKSFLYHEISVEPDNIIADVLGGAGDYKVNSWHHQAVDKLGKGIKAVAFSPDGIVEAIIREDKDYAIGLQFHPEAMIRDGDYSVIGLYKELVKRAEARRDA